MQQLKLTQKLLQKLSPQQILLMKLLQVPSVALDQRIKQEIEENPALEDLSQEMGEQDDSKDELSNEADQAEDSKNEDEFDLSDYMQDDETPEYRMQTNNYPEEDKKDIPYANTISFYEMLQSQLGDAGFTDDQRVIAETIIGNIDDSGYLDRDIESIVDDLAFTQGLITKVEDVEKVLEEIQKFDPAGVGGRNLQECLMIQLKKKDTIRPFYPNGHPYFRPAL